MNKRNIIFASILSLICATPAWAEKPVTTSSAGPDPMITIALKCDDGNKISYKHCRYFVEFALPGWEFCTVEPQPDDPWVRPDDNPGANEFTPDLKNEALAAAIIGADHQTGIIDGADLNNPNIVTTKCSCMVLRTTPANDKEKVAYYVETPEDLEQCND